MKRFYKEVSVAETGDGWQVMLDGRGIKTVKGAAQIVPSRALAEAMAEEWATQGEKIDPATMLKRDQADYAIDLVAQNPASVIDEMIGFIETDTLCYRADPDEALFARQLETWEPLLEAFEAREAVKMVRVSGIMHRPQSPDTIEKMRQRLGNLDPFALAGLQAMASLTASLTIALSALEDGADLDLLWS
ncbi:MAG: molecular chaperone, partial [Sphingomonadales bacterium]